MLPKGDLNVSINIAINLMGDKGLRSCEPPSSKLLKPCRKGEATHLKVERLTYDIERDI